MSRSWSARRVARERPTVPENTKSLNIKHRAPPAGSILLSSRPRFPSSRGWRSIWISLEIPFYAFNSYHFEPSTGGCRHPCGWRAARKVGGRWIKRKKIAARIPRARFRPVDAALEKRGRGHPVKTQGLPGRRAGYCDEGLHLLTRTSAPLLITQSNGRRLLLSAVLSSAGAGVGVQPE